ncbi:hypothetical protein CHGG_09252 [Chaetomium globosum CBS 148.51]|uniref:Reverse transcriptase domain-containing protein n=1 Tax=Chaetomium globosum (strain ATCC 6205 / CBS 148.51 / DSM 1962 / NBRC 6347 / NRRL 1970) TaxID=306901 RepID=Q2GS02_CHAGB|nr:uncharacterized protein CHGG_09252 [Chaetomium globosum CBS 148.51]EAQ85238.1 hypothetical protein CHGG_09252 [Chaetomium globosum CBS 148.51]
MGNREHRSTEVAIRLVVAQVQEAWRQKATASLLQLDISGAFDTVNHTRLLATLRLQGYPQWVVLWVKAWLSNRVAILHFDGQKTEDIPVIAGVPQGSPLSPILFILYIASLGACKGLVKSSEQEPSNSSRAYKSAPIRCLETEAWVPPLDLYLNKRPTDFEGRLQKQALQSGAGPEAERITTGHLITEACNTVYRRFNKRRKTRGRRPRQGPQSPTPTELAASVVAQRIADEDPPALLFTNKVLTGHEGLSKAQSSLLSQARIGDIGLRDYLFRVKVPEVRTPYCECGRGRETVEHLVVWCPDPPLQRPWDGREIRSHRDLQTVLRGVGARSRRFVRKVLGWLMDSGRLLEYSLARRLELETVDGEG